ncbi:hypothetical protein [Mycobacterium sp. IDR2000157661]|uniref:hypothetical protein n=1 Tax=Mycobacterium sp. IDR2000157661 TaxID=2867005 RepID=UPI001EED5F30|nr:hypothetical protein [Mycobacterium sp. IDR2000157661]ULE35217.1 hypothetical protein K3G64_12015 [Mycobacterium sp. IDR2000157661]
MSTPRSRAQWLRGGLVGACSAVVTAGAHTSAGADLPGGAALTLALLVCATFGAVLARIRLDGRYARMFGVVGALSLAQVLGHLTFVIAGGHHHADPFGLTGSMMVAHVAAALALGVAISAAEYLYVVCSSVLHWLRVFAALVIRPQSRSTRFVLRTVVAEPVLLNSGLGMRAPPGRIATAR